MQNGNDLHCTVDLECFPVNVYLHFFFLSLVGIGKFRGNINSIHKSNHSSILILSFVSFYYYQCSKTSVMSRLTMPLHGWIHAYIHITILLNNHCLSYTWIKNVTASWLCICTASPSSKYSLSFFLSSWFSFPFLSTSISLSLISLVERNSFLEAIMHTQQKHLRVLLQRMLFDTQQVPHCSTPNRD